MKLTIKNNYLDIAVGKLAIGDVIFESSRFLMVTGYTDKDITFVDLTSINDQRNQPNIVFIPAGTRYGGRIYQAEIIITDGGA